MAEAWDDVLVEVVGLISSAGVELGGGGCTTGEVASPGVGIGPLGSENHNGEVSGRKPNKRVSPVKRSERNTLNT